jgi:rare lipoprotein A
MAGGGRLVCVLAVVALLGACASSGPRASGSAAGGPRPGGYYLDDGPGANPPPNLDAVPDAQPRAETVRVANTRPYSAMGRTYVPMTNVQPYSQTGIASWYGKRYHGQPTASGERYDMYAMTAAHPTLPIPSYARVSLLDDSRSVVVRINDRGPFHADRVIDLSYTAAYKLGILAGGSARVRVESIVPGAEPLREPANVIAASDKPAATTPAGSAGAAVAPGTAPGQDGNASSAAQPVQATAVTPVATAAPPAPGVYLQLGAFSIADNADSFLRRMRLELPVLDGLATVVPGDGVYRVQAGPYATRAQAQQIADRIQTILDLKPLLVIR